MHAAAVDSELYRPALADLTVPLGGLTRFVSAVDAIAHVLCGQGPEVTESARAHSYYSTSTGTQIGDPRLYHFYTLFIGSKCVFYTRK